MIQTSCDCDKKRTSFNAFNLVGVNSYTQIVAIVGFLAILTQVVINDAIINNANQWWYTLTRLVISLVLLFFVIQVVGCATTHAKCPFVGVLFLIGLAFMIVVWLIQVSTTLGYATQTDSVKIK